MKRGIFNAFVAKVCGHFLISEGDLFKKDKRTEIVEARHLLYYLCFNRGIKIATIVEYMKEKGYNIEHNSIINGIKGMKAKISSDKDYLRIYNTLQKTTE